MPSLSASTMANIMASVLAWKRVTRGSCFCSGGETYPAYLPPEFTVSVLVSFLIHWPYYGICPPHRRTTAGFPSLQPEVLKRVIVPSYAQLFSSHLGQKRGSRGSHTRTALPSTQRCNDDFLLCFSSATAGGSLETCIRTWEYLVF